MDIKYWLDFCKQVGEKVFLDTRKIEKSEGTKIMGKGAGGDETLFIDAVIEKKVYDALEKTGKDFIFISEECSRKVVGKNPEVVIVLDPLDGSDNFYNGIPFYCLSISVASSEVLKSVQVAYVINLVTGDVYTAVRNEGAYKNGKKIVCKKNSKCVFAESTKSGASKLFKINENFSTRKLGCACLAICFVAEGMADACVITGGTRTIEAATYLITKEAGGIVTDLKGKKIEETKIGLDVNLDLMISSNKEIHSKILSLIKKVEPWVIWITGLPGSGKSATSRELLNLLEKNSIPVQYLQLDVIRKTLVPNPKYDEEERDYVYRSLMLTAKYLSDNGINVVLDATCHKREWRALARELIKNYYEVYLKCPLKVCMERETGRKSNLVKRELYMKASERLKSGKQFEGIGQVPGIDVEYEEPENPDLTIESDKTDSEKSAKIILEKMKSR